MSTCITGEQLPSHASVATLARGGCFVGLDTSSSQTLLRACLRAISYEEAELFTFPKGQQTGVGQQKSCSTSDYIFDGRESHVRGKAVDTRHA